MERGSGLPRPRLWRNGAGGGRQGRLPPLRGRPTVGPDSRHPPRKRASTRKPGGNALAGLRGAGYSDWGTPARSKNSLLSAASTMSVTAYPRSFNTHALLRAWPHIGVQRHLLLPLTQGQRTTGSVGRTAVESIPSRIRHARILHAPLKVVCMQIACMYARTLLQWWAWKPSARSNTT